MRSRALSTLVLAAAGAALAFVGYAFGARTSADRSPREASHPHAVCVRPADVRPTPGSPTTTRGLQDQLILDHSRGENPNAGYTHTHRLKVIRQTYSPGGTHHAHQHPDAEQAYYILEGKARVRLGDQTYEAGPGTVCYIPSGVEHQLWNIGDTTLVNLLIDVALDENEPN